MLTSVPLWAILAAHVAQSFGYYVLFTELPTYMKNILHFNLENSAFLSAIPYVAYIAASFASSILVDLVIQRGMMSTTAARKTTNSIGTLVSGAGLVGTWIQFA